MGVYGLYIALQQNLNINLTWLPYCLYLIKFVQKLHVFQRVFIAHPTFWITIVTSTSCVCLDTLVFMMTGN